VTGIVAVPNALITASLAHLNPSPSCVHGVMGRFISAAVLRTILHPGAPELARNSNCRGPDLPENSISGRDSSSATSMRPCVFYLYFHGLEDLLFLPVDFGLLPGDLLDRYKLRVCGRSPPVPVTLFPHSSPVPLTWAEPWPLRCRLAFI
jgi:hypothetical protein